MNNKNIKLIKEQNNKFVFLVDNEKLEIYAPNYDKAIKRLKSVIEYNKGK